MKYREAIAQITEKLMDDERVLLLGQGVADYKGIWGTTIGLKKNIL